MHDDELIEFAQFPDLLGAVMRMGEEMFEQENQLDVH